MTEVRNREQWIVKLATITQNRIWENSQSGSGMRLDTNKHVLGNVLRIEERGLMNNNEDRGGAMACM